MKWLGVIVFLSMMPAWATDPGGKYAQADPKMHEWFENLRSGKGPCCSDADGFVVQDVDWVSVNDPSKPNVHFRVRIPNRQKVGDPMEWFDVPDEAVLTQPNLYGKTMVWPMFGYAGVIIRCFILGAGT
jgi:hypothetical protein